MKKFGPTPQLLVVQNQPGAGEKTHFSQVIAVLKQLPAWHSFDWSNSNPSHPDLTILNQDQEGLKIEQIRTTMADCAYPPYQASERVVVLLHLDQASLPAQQALLKFLEEPPRYVRIMATTDQLSAILPTIQSRCQVRLIQSTQPSNSATNHHAIIEQLLTNQLSYAQIIKLVEAYPDRPEAITFLSELLWQLRTSESYPSTLAVRAGQIISSSWVKLHQNTNVRLTLEDCFFSIKKTSTTTSS